MLMLSVQKLAKWLGGRFVLDGLDLELARGETAHVLGSNGSGKSTLLRVLSGVFEAEAGEVFIAGVSLKSDPVRAKAQVGYVPDGLEALPDLSVSEFVQLARALKGLPGAPGETETDWKQRLGLDPVWRRRVNTLSFGQRKRVLSLVALLGNPGLLLLDEPSNGLDPGGIDLMVALCEERQRAGQCQLIATNDLAFVERVGGLCYRLLHGRLEPASASST